MAGYEAYDLKQVTDAARKENQEPVADQVICWVFFTFNKHSEFLASLVVCIHETVGLCRVDCEQSLW